MLVMSPIKLRLFGRLDDFLEQRTAAAQPGRVCWACPAARKWKSSTQPDGGEGLVKRKGFDVRRGPKEAGTNVRVDEQKPDVRRLGRTSKLCIAKSKSIKSRPVVVEW